jgi:hypothetical protein
MQKLRLICDFRFSVPSSPTPHLHRTLHVPGPSEVISLRKALLRANHNLHQLDDEIAHVRAVLDELHRKHEPLRQYITEHPAFLLIRRLRKALLNLHQLDDEIAHVWAVLDELHRKCEALHKFTKEHDAFLAPIRRLPAEILTYIFSLCLPEYEASGFDSQRTPLLIGQVCVSWRKASLSIQKPIPTLIYKTCGSSLTSIFSVPPSPTPRLHRMFHAPGPSEVISLRKENTVRHTIRSI